MAIKGNNKILMWIIILAVVLVIMAWYGNSMSGNNIGSECVTDLDCVPKECCHPTTCVVSGSQENCATVLCTAECSPGTLDCGQGSCLCVNGKCNAFID